MKMKKIFFTLAIFAGLVAFSSCEGNFDPKIYGTLTTTNFPASESDYESELMICYVPYTMKWSHSISSQQHNFYAAEGGIWRVFDSTTDVCDPVLHLNWGDGWLRMTQCAFSYYETQNRGYNSGVNSYYDGLRDVTRFTKIIGDFRDADESVLSANKKKQFEAEARICRGLMMYYLLHLYGPLPFILDPADVGTEKESALERPSLDEISQWIYDDFDYASQNAPETQSEQGRYTADYARFLLMRHCLNEGSHMSGWYQKAASLFSEFTGGYTLFTDPGDSGNPYVELFRTKNDFSVEDIMEVSCSSGPTGSDGQGNFNPWYFYIASGNASSVKVAPDGRPNWNSKCGAGGSWAQTIDVSPTFYDTYEEGDLRKGIIVTETYYNGVGWIGRDEVGDLWDGFIVNKYPHEEASNYQSNDISLARWGDVLLLYAEALVRANNAVSAEAVNAVNQVRHRAGLDDLTADKTASTSAFLDAILLERGHECLYEGGRKIDLIRFGRYYQTMSALGRTPDSEYWPVPNFSVEQAANSGYTLTQYYTRPDYDGPQRTE